MSTYDGQPWSLVPDIISVSTKSKKMLLYFKKLYGSFLWMGFNCLKARVTLRRQFTFYHYHYPYHFFFYQCHFLPLSLSLLSVWSPFEYKSISSFLSVKRKFPFYWLFLQFFFFFNADLHDIRYFPHFPLNYLFSFFRI